MQISMKTMETEKKTNSPNKLFLSLATNCLISIRIRRWQNEIWNDYEWRARRRFIQIKQEVNVTEGKHKKENQRRQRQKNKNCAS